MTVKNAKQEATMKRYKRIILIVGLVMAFSLILKVPTVLANTDLNGVFVFIERTDQKGGLTKDQIQTDIELRLKSAGIRVLNEEDWFENLHLPLLQIRVVNHAEKQGIFICSFSYVLGHSRHFFGKIGNKSFNKESALIGNTKHVQGLIKEMVDAFINDYLSVNPKK